MGCFAKFLSWGARLYGIICIMKQLVGESEKIATICKKNDISFLGVFGSVAKNTNSAKSDVDLLARFSKKKSLLDLIRVEEEFEQVLGKEVDLLTESSISPYLKESITKSTLPLYEG